MSRRWLPWLALAVVLAAVLAVGVGSSGDDDGRGDRVDDLAGRVRCPLCRGQSVGDSDSPAAEGIRTVIAERVEAGESDDEILGYLVSRYGEEILLTPPRSGVGLVVWALPVAALVAAVAGLAVAFRRWRTMPGGADVTDADRDLVERARRAR